MTAEQLQATYKVCERKRQNLLGKVERGKTPPQWIMEEIKFIESIENLAEMHYRKCQAYEQLNKLYERLVTLFQIVERAFFGFVPFRHGFQWYKNRVQASHIQTLTLLNLFSLLPESDQQRRELIINMINEHITEPVSAEGYNTRLANIDQRGRKAV